MTKAIVPPEEKTFEGDWSLCQAAIKVSLPMKKIPLGYQNLIPNLFLYNYLHKSQEILLNVRLIFIIQS